MGWVIFASLVVLLPLGAGLGAPPDERLADAVPIPELPDVPPSEDAMEHLDTPVAEVPVLPPAETERVDVIFEEVGASCLSGPLFAEPMGRRTPSERPDWVYSQVPALPMADFLGEGIGPVWRIDGDGVVIAMLVHDERSHWHVIGHPFKVAGAPLADIVAALESFEPRASSALAGWAITEAWMGPMRQADLAAVCAALAGPESPEPPCVLNSTQGYFLMLPNYCQHGALVVRFHIDAGSVERVLWPHSDLHRVFCAAVRNAHADVLDGPAYYSPPLLVYC